MAIDTRDKVIAQLGKQYLINKIAWSGEGAGTFFSLWKIAGKPVAGANPPLFSAGSGYVPTRTTAGALGQVDPGVGEESNVLSSSLVNTTAGTFWLADRLWACSGFACNINTLQSITTPGVLPSGRDPNSGDDVLPFGEFYGAPGATGGTWTLTGTDAAGNTNRTWTYTHPANAESVGQMIQFFPGGGSPAATLGIRVPVSLQLSASTGTAGDFGLTLLRLTSCHRIGASNIVDMQDVLMLGKPRVYADACLFLMALSSATASGVTMGQIGIGSA